MALIGQPIMTRYPGFIQFNGTQGHRYFECTTKGCKERFPSGKYAVKSKWTWKDGSIRDEPEFSIKTGRPEFIHTALGGPCMNGEILKSCPFCCPD